jgi:hypothetical protein
MPVSSSQRCEAEGLCVQGQSELHRETLSQTSSFSSEKKKKNYLLNFPKDDLSKYWNWKIN